MITTRNWHRAAVATVSLSLAGICLGSPAPAGLELFNSTSIALAEEAQQGGGQYADGSYGAAGEGMGGQVPVTVVIEGGVVASVTIGENSETPGIGSQAIEQLPPAIIAANGTEGVDAVAGASVTSQAILSAVNSCLTEAASKAQAQPAGNETESPADEASAENTEEASESQIPQTVDIAGIQLVLPAGFESLSYDGGARAYSVSSGIVIDAGIISLPAGDPIAGLVEVGAIGQVSGTFNLYGADGSIAGTARVFNMPSGNDSLTFYIADCTTSDGRNVHVRISWPASMTQANHDIIASLLACLGTTGQGEVDEVALSLLGMTAEESTQAAPATEEVPQGPEMQVLQFNGMQISAPAEMAFYQENNGTVFYATSQNPPDMMVHMNCTGMYSSGDLETDYLSIQYAGNQMANAGYTLIESDPSTTPSGQPPYVLTFDDAAGVRFTYVHLILNDGQFGQVGITYWPNDPTYAALVPEMIASTDVAW